MAMRWAFTAWSQGIAIVPPRLHISLPEGDRMSLIMPAYIPKSPDGSVPEALVVKELMVSPANPLLGLTPFQGGVLMIDPETGVCNALLEGVTLTALRTGACSGLTSDLLARPDAATVAIIGTGPQAYSQLEAVCAVRNIQTAWICSRSRANAEQFAAELAGKGSIPEQIIIAESAKEAVRNADIVCTATSSQNPLFEYRDLKPGAHINAIGSFRANMQELSAETVYRSRLFVDNRAGVQAESGDFLIPMQMGLIDASHILGEIGDILLNCVEGRRDANELTLYKSVGLGVQDAAAAAVALARAEAQQIGQVVNW